MSQTGDLDFNTGVFRNTLQNYTVVVRSAHSCLRMNAEMDCEVCGLEKMERLRNERKEPAGDADSSGASRGDIGKAVGMSEASS